MDDDTRRNEAKNAGHAKTARSADARANRARTPRPFEARAQPRSDDAKAFLPDPDERGWRPVRDDLAETLGEGFVAAATTGENVEDETLDQIVPEEIGGPFIETRDTQEFALGSDDMNPEGAEREPLPRAISGLVSAPLSEEMAAEQADGAEDGAQNGLEDGSEDGLGDGSGDDDIDGTRPRDVDRRRVAGESGLSLTAMRRSR